MSHSIAIYQRVYREHGNTEREDEIKEEMNTLERGAIRDDKEGSDGLRDGQVGDVEKAGVNGVAGDGEDMMGEFHSFSILRLMMCSLTSPQATIHQHRKTFLL